ncbi:hypothetical protein DW241_04935 [Hungatella hathewayi]|nr:hypothetical protein DW241_04935 [Hungatella hathewayi]
MLGLKTQESDKFNRFWELVQAEAARQNKVFFADCGEGHILETATIECEDMRGWLVQKGKAKEFEQEWRQDQVSNKWIDCIFWAEWSENDGDIKIRFETY